MTTAELRADIHEVAPIADAMDASATAGPSAMRALLERSDRKGLERLAVHLGLIALSSVGIYFVQDSLLVVPAMIVQGILIAYLFSPLHEGSHYTPFKTRWLTELVAWLSGVAIIWNSSYMRYSHLWHHRYIQDPTRDPELASPKPTNIKEYLRRLSGFDYLRGNIRDQLRILSGRYEAMPYIPEAARPAARRSVLWQFAVYATVAAVAIRYPVPVLIYWLAPLLLGYPFLLTVLIAEHAGCAENGDNYANTRTTYTWWPLRLIFWNMNYHAEHHVNPAIPFHALPAAHQLMKSRVTHISSGGYISWTGSYIRKLRAT